MPRRAQQERPSRTARETAAYRRAVRQLGGRLKELRTERGWTLEHAAELADMDLKHWQKIEAGQLNVTMVTLVRMAEGLGVGLGELFLGKHGQRAG
jgi:transcriptional regulator with XRE-family HTH domain